MKLLNRSAVLLQPLQPYLDWINALPLEVSELEQPLATGALNDEGRVYLVDEFETPAEADEALAGCWQQLFENELGAWDELAVHWPEPLSQQQLSLWFEIKAVPLAFDSSNKSLMMAQL
ncbi:MAG: hypothetical protein V7707_18420 [Motiliproteus sp.]